MNNLEGMKAKLAEIKNEFELVNKRRAEDLERLHKLQGAYAVLDELITKEEAKEQKKDGRKSRRTKVATNKS